jgi:hypothetical protein
LQAQCGVEFHELAQGLSPVFVRRSAQSWIKKGKDGANPAPIGEAGPQKMQKVRKIKIVVDRGNPRRLYTPHKDGDALGDVLLRFSRNAGCTPRDNRVCDLCLFDATLFEN